jgi:hypothetical protein
MLEFLPVFIPLFDTVLSVKLKETSSNEPEELSVRVACSSAHCPSVTWSVIE